MELRYFGGLTIEEVAECMNISTATIKRETRIAQAWLQREMVKSADQGAEAADDASSSPPQDPAN